MRLCPRLWSDSIGVGTDLHIVAAIDEFVLDRVVTVFKCSDEGGPGTGQVVAGVVRR
jgi:hypothetical protein